MSFNISGIAINTNCDKDLFKLSQLLGIGLEELMQDNIESVFGSISNEEAYVYFGKRGAIIFLNVANTIETKIDESIDYYRFVIAETADAYLLKGKTKQLDYRQSKFAVIEGFEESKTNPTDLTQLVVDEIESLSGINFYSVEDGLLFCELSF